jgi:hypothetical protein
MAVYCQFFVLCVSAWFTELKYLILARMNNVFPVTRTYWMYNFIRGICVCSNNTFMYSVVCLKSYKSTTYSKNCNCLFYTINTLVSASSGFLSFFWLLCNCDLPCSARSCLLWCIFLAMSLCSKLLQSNWLIWMIKVVLFWDVKWCRLLIGCHCFETA